MISKDNIAIEAATDGACSGNPGPGGWGVIIKFIDGSEIEFGGSDKETTNNRMELTAAIKALEQLKQFKLKDNFKLRIDSKYVIEGYSKWIYNWKKNGWKTSSGKQVQNSDLWQKIDKLRLNGVEMEFVKGHSGDPSNERVDFIATNYSKGIKVNQSIPVKNTKINDFQSTVSQELNKTFSNLELISKFAKSGYLLNTQELNKLLKIEDNKSVNNFESFEWRNWQIVPVDQKYWQIVLKEK